MSEINWDRFDYRYVLHYTKHPGRFQRCLEEFARVGLTDVKVFVDAPSPFTQTFNRALRMPDYMRPNGWARHFFPVTMGHYRMLNAAWHMDAKHVLAMENDVCFLSDAEKLTTLVNSLPEDFDIALFDWEILPTKRDEAKEQMDFLSKLPNIGPWKKLTEWVDLRSFGCRAFSRKGLRRYLDFIETAADGKHELPVIDADLCWDARRRWPVSEVYFAWPNGAVQKPFPGETGPCGGDVLAMRHALIGVYDADYGAR